MRKAIAILVVLSLVAFAGQASVDLNPVNRDGDWLEYDDGTPGWYTWGATYRGVWFNVQDFFPTATDGWLEQAEFWFYHEETSHPWDTSDVYAEIWNGDVNGPVTQIDQQMITALDYAPVYSTYTGETCVVEQNFWAAANVSMSSGGWPSLLLDDQDSAVAHSFLSDDLIVWEPYTLTSGKIINFLLSVEWNPVENAFSNSTWGSLKATF